MEEMNYTVETMEDEENVGGCAVKECSVFMVSPPIGTNPAFPVGASDRGTA